MPHTELQNLICLGTNGNLPIHYTQYLQHAGQSDVPLHTLIKFNCAHRVYKNAKQKPVQLHMAINYVQFTN